MADELSDTRPRLAGTREIRVGVNDEDRTHDLLSHSQAFYQLNYTHHICPMTFGRTFDITLVYVYDRSSRALIFGELAVPALVLDLFD